MNYKAEYLRWLNNENVDEATKSELKAIENDEEQIKFRFSRFLEFGTGGLRGTMIAGTNAMNVYTVAKATQGFASYIIKEGAADRGVVITNDSRNNSRAFAEITAEVFAANGIRAYLFESLRPTPVLSFAIRHLGCVAGVNITASHNPKEYNGYKAYWDDGAQLSLEQADEVSAYINATDIFDGVKRMPLEGAIRCGMVKIVGEDVDKVYLENVIAQRVDTEIIPKMADQLRIVYTPLHGCGHKLVPEALSLCGVKHLYTVSEQMVLDGNFPTVKSPNPENVEALALGEKLAKQVQSDLVIATDPDADRAGILVLSSDGEFVKVTGHQVGALLLDYILTAYENTNTMPDGPYAVKTIVTTEIAQKICEEHGVYMYNVLTGFKFIGEVIKNHDDVGDGHFLFGFEESYGYLKGTYSRDKDAVVAVMLITEMAAYYKSKGMTLYDALQGMFKRYGYYMEETINHAMKGTDAAEQMEALMQRIRNNPPSHLGGNRVVSVRDYLKETITDLETGEVSPTNLPISNVLFYAMKGSVGDNVLVIRPSGTEPKVKLYLLVNGKTKEESEKVLSLLRESVNELIK